jgi:hypothetical protein
MQIFALFLGSIFGYILDFFLKYLTRRLAYAAAIGVAMTALTSALVLAFKGLIATIAIGLPPSVTGLTAILPTNLYVCFSALQSARLLRWTFDWNSNFVQKRMF